MKKKAILVSFSKYALMWSSPVILGAILMGDFCNGIEIISFPNYLSTDGL
jgi:hypothetical protein